MELWSGKADTFLKRDAVESTHMMLEAIPEVLITIDEIELSEVRH